MDLHSESGRLTARALRTQRLRLKPFCEADLDAVTRQVGDFAVARMLTRVPHPYTRADAEAFLALDAAGEAGALWMIHDATGLVGAISVDPDLGYWLGRAHWGKGYMTEAAEAVVPATFATGIVAEIRSSHFEGNTGSRRVLEKLGFVKDGHSTHHSLSRGGEVPVRRMRLTRTDWEARP